MIFILLLPVCILLELLKINKERMVVKMDNKYQYKDLLRKAETGTEIDLKHLFAWFEKYDPYSWNGEGFIIDDSRILIPVYKQCGNNFDIVGYEIK